MWFLTLKYSIFGEKRQLFECAQILEWEEVQCDIDSDHNLFSIDSLMTFATMNKIIYKYVM